MADPVFATPAELNTFTGRSIPNAQATMMLAQAAAAIRAYCGWHIYASKEVHLTLDGPGTIILSLPSLLVTEVDTVTEDDDDLVVDDDYQWSAMGVLRRVGTNWTDKLGGVVVTFTHGYAVLPPEIQAVCLQAAARAVASPSGIKSEQSGGLSVTYAIPGGLMELEKSVLNRYRVPQTP